MMLFFSNIKWITNENGFIHANLGFSIDIYYKYNVFIKQI
jgi:hypothetical protein